MALRMPAIDVVHRALLFGLVGLGAGGIILGVQVHRDILHRGKGMPLLRLAREMEIQKESALREGKEIENEKALVEAAQNILKSRNT